MLSSIVTDWIFFYKTHKSTQRDKFEIIWMRMGQIIRSPNDINLSDTLLNIQKLSMFYFVWFGWVYSFANLFPFNKKCLNSGMKNFHSWTKKRLFKNKQFKKLFVYLHSFLHTFWQFPNIRWIKNSFKNYFQSLISLDLSFRGWEDKFNSTYSREMYSGPNK